LGFAGPKMAPEPLPAHDFAGFGNPKSFN